MRLVALRRCFSLSILGLAFAGGVSAQSVCTFSGQNDQRLLNHLNGANMAQNCTDGATPNWTRRYPLTHGAVEYLLKPPGCDPNVGSCTVAASVHGATAGMHQNSEQNLIPPITMEWRNSSNTIVGQCGIPGANQNIDAWDAQMSVTFSCAGGMVGVPGAYTYRTVTRPCADQVQTSSFVLTTESLRQLFCPQPRKYACPEDSDCKSCIKGSPGGGVGAGGGPPGLGGGAAVRRICSTPQAGQVARASRVRATGTRCWASTGRTTTRCASCRIPASTTSG